jgi:hypothetical protein
MLNFNSLFLHDLRIPTAIKKVTWNLKNVGLFEILLVDEFMPLFILFLSSWLRRNKSFCERIGYLVDWYDH